MNKTAQSFQSKLQISCCAITVPALLLLPSPLRDRGLRTSTLCGSLGFLEATLEAATLIGLAGWQDSAALSQI